MGMPKVKPTGVRDLLELPRPAPSVPWAYLKVAEGCDRACAFCAIPSFRGKQRSRTSASIEAEARSLVEAGVAELVLVAQDLAWYGRDIGEPGSLAPLLRRLDTLAPHGLQRVRLLYLYPSEVRDPLVSTMLELPTVVPYFDLSLQHADAALLRAHEAMGERRPLPHRHRRRSARRSPTAAFRSSFIVGFPGETEREHDELLEFLEAASLDWAGFFPFSPEDGTPAATLPDAVDPDLVVRVVARVRGGAGADHPRGARRARRPARSRCSSTRSTTPTTVSASPSGARTARPPRSTASCGSTPTFARPGRPRACARHRGDRAGSRGQVARAPSRWWRRPPS